MPLVQSLGASVTLNDSGVLAGLHNIATKAREVELSLQSMGKAMDRAVASGRKIGSVGAAGGGGGLSGIGSGGNPTAAYARIRVAQEQTTRAQMAADAKLAQQRDRLASQAGLVEQRTARAAVQVERERISLRSQTLRLGQQEAAIAQRNAASQASTMRASLNQARQTVQAQQQITRYQQQQRAQLGGGLGGFIGNLLTPGQRASGNALGGALGGIGGALANIFGANQPQQQQQQGRSALGGAASAAGRGIRSVGVGGIAFGSLLGNLGARAVVGAGQFAGSQFGQAFDAIQSNERLNSSFQTLIARDLMQQNKGLSGADALQQALPATKDLRSFVLQKAIKSPFGEEDVAGIFQKFLTVGFTQAEGKKMTTEMVDLASAYRLDGSEMGRLAKALGDVKSRGTLSAEEVRQFVNARFDIQGALANVLGKSREEIVKLQKEKKITIDDVMKAFDSVAGAEPIQGSAERLANSWGGLAETLHDVGRVMRRELGAGSFDALQPYVVRFSNFLQEQLASGKVKELGQKLGGFVASGLDMGEKAIGRLSTAWETFNRVREMGLPKTAVGMGLQALGLPPDISRTVASWSVDAVTAIQTGIGKVRSALSTYSQIKGDGGSTAYATFSALEAAGLPADVATTIGNWASMAEVELQKIGPRLQKAIRDGSTGSTVGLWELIGIENDVATKIDAEIKQAAAEIGKGLAQLPSEIDAYKKLGSGETSFYDFLKGRGADPNSIGMRGIQAFGKADSWMKDRTLPTWAQPFGENGAPHPGWAQMGMGPGAMTPPPLNEMQDIGAAEQAAAIQAAKPSFDAYVQSLQAVDQANQAAAASAGMLGQAVPPATAAIGGMTSVTDPAATSLGAMTMAADPASASLNNVGTGGQSAALGVSALNSAASTTDLAAATDQYLALSRALYAVSGSYQTAAEKAESAKKSLEHFNMPEALVQHSPSPFEQALLDAGEAGVNFSNSMRLAGVGIAGASRAVQMGQAEWEDFGIAMKNSGNIAAGLDPVDRGSLATASTMNAGLARPVSAGGARQTGAAIPIKGKTPGLVQQAKSPEIKPVDLRAEAWNKKVSGAMGAVSGLTGERERGDIGRIAEQYLMKLGVTPDESRTVGDYVRSSINTRRDKNGNLPDLQQALEAFGTPSGDSMADEVQKFLERLGVTNDRIEGATEALTRAENGVKNKMGPQVPDAVTTGQKLLKDQLEGLLGRAGVSKENIPGALEKLHGSGALEGLDQQLFQTRQTGIADQIANMLGGTDSKERRARVAAIMGSGAFGDFNPDWLNTPTAAQDRQELQTRRNDNPRYADGTSVPTSGTDRTTASVQGATAIIQVVLDPDKMVDLVLPRAVDRLKLQGIRPG